MDSEEEETPRALILLLQRAIEGYGIYESEEEEKDEKQENG